VTHGDGVSIIAEGSSVDGVIPRQGAPRQWTLDAVADWLGEKAWKWTQLKGLHARKLERVSQFAVVACPAMAIIYNYLEASGIVQHADLEHFRRYFPMELIVAYFVALPYAVGSLAYELGCPTEIKEYVSSDRYVTERRGQNDTQQEEITSALAKFFRTPAGATAGINAPNIELQLNAIIRDTLSPEETWVLQNKKRPLTRTATSVLYGISIGLSVIVLAWTTPRHVFHLGSPVEVFAYLFGN
jgi:hypothetical protein